MNKTVIALALATMVASVCCAASDQPCLRYPKRGFANDTVDLTPLFEWWKETSYVEKQSNDMKRIGQESKARILLQESISGRPLKSWLRISGTCDGPCTGLGWTVYAEEIQDRPSVHKPPQRIFLRHPPTREKARFDELVRLLPNVGGAQHDALEKEWLAIPGHKYRASTYRIDFFAMDTGEKNTKGYPIFDLGRVVGAQVQ